MKLIMFDRMDSTVLKHLLDNQKTMVVVAAAIMAE